MTNLMKRSSPWVSLLGIFTLIAGLGLDAIVHRRDATLAAREGIFTLSNPGHLLFALGIALTVLGALFFLLSRALDGKFSLPRLALWGGAASLLVACSLVSFALVASTEGALASSHSHSHDESGAAQTADTHTHDVNNPDGLSHQHLESSAHIQLTAAHPQTSADVARANAVKLATQRATEKYRDVQVAERDGYKMFGQGTPGQTEYHYSKTWNSFLAGFSFDPTKPTSLLYHKDANGNMVLAGVMYFTPAHFTETQIDQRYPISMGQWHKHVNVCIAPKGMDVASAYLGANARFGPSGSIATQSECNAAQGKFYPTLFGWMVHVYFD